MGYYKHDYTTITKRLVEMIRRLHDGHELVASVLAQEFDVDPRTIKRYYEHLMWLPVETSRGGRLRMKAGRTLLQEEASQRGRVALDLLQGIGNAMGAEYAQDIRKLFDQLQIVGTPPIYARLNMEDISEKASLIAQLEQAIDNSLQIGCLYGVGISGRNRIEMTLQPLKLVCFEGFWYLLAIDTKDGLLKKLHLSSIETATISNDSFKPDDTLQRNLENALSVWFDPSQKSVEVLLLAEKEIARYFDRKPLPGQRIIRRLLDGSMEIAICITHEMELFPLVQYWIPYLKVIEPTDLADKLKAELRTYLEALG